ncbi:ras-domain-containing protein, partial [Gymnopus androsaceus JB14]
TTYKQYLVDIEVDGKHVELEFYDTSFADAELNPDQIRQLSYDDAHVVVICFGIDSPDSISNLEHRWKPEVRHFCPGIPIILVGCKSDLRYDPKTISELKKTKQAPVTHEEAMAASMKIGAMMYLECSSLTSAGVREIFQNATRAALQQSKPQRPKLTGL